MSRLGRESEALRAARLAVEAMRDERAAAVSAYRQVREACDAAVIEIAAERDAALAALEWIHDHNSRVVGIGYVGWQRLRTVSKARRALGRPYVRAALDEDTP